MSEKPATQSSEPVANAAGAESMRAPPAPPPPGSARRNSGIRPPPAPPPPPARARASQDLTYPGATPATAPSGAYDPLAPVPSATSTAPLHPMPAPPAPASPARAHASQFPPAAAISMLAPPMRSSGVQSVDAPAVAPAPLPSSFPAAPPTGFSDPLAPVIARAPSAPPAPALAPPARTPSAPPASHAPPAPRPSATSTYFDPLAPSASSGPTLSAPSLADPLAGLMAPLAPPARPSSPPEREKRAGGVRWGAVGLAVGACVLLMGAVFGVAWQLRPAAAPAATLPPEAERETPPPPPPSSASSAPAAQDPAAPEVFAEDPGPNGQDSHVRTVRIGVRVAPPGTTPGGNAAARVVAPAPAGPATIATAPPATPPAPRAAATPPPPVNDGDGSCVQRCGGRVDCIMRCPRDSIRAASHPTTSASQGGSETSSGNAAGAGPTRDEVLLAMNGVRGGVLLCAMGLVNAPPSARVTVTFGSSGHVLGVAVAPPFAGTPQGACIQRAVRRAAVPPFERPTFQVAFPFAVR